MPGIGFKAAVYESGKGGGFVLPSYTGSYAIFGDETKGYIELYDSGTLTLAPWVYDLHLVGGGANAAGAGGGGGYTSTYFAQNLNNKTYEVIVGAGAVASGTALSGGTTGIDDFTANGGSGKNGGSGGGADGSCNISGSSGNWNVTGYDAGAGGSNGSNGANGQSNKRTGGTGQGTPTYDFNDSALTLRAGGGGGGADYESYGGDSDTAKSGAGGAGGGGKGGAHNANGFAGSANTGGGGGGKGNRTGQLAGAGGSGIVIVRWEAPGVGLENRIGDPGFEAGSSYWQASGTLAAQITRVTSPVHEGSYAMCGPSNIVGQDPILWGTVLTDPQPGHKFYFRQYIRNDANKPMTSHCVVYGNTLSISAENTGGAFKMFSTIGESGTSDSSTYLATMWNDGDSDGGYWYLDGNLLIDLTEAFGVGKEPTKEWCDAHIPYFADTTWIGL